MLQQLSDINEENLKKAKEKLEKIESKGIVAKVICNVTDIEQINNFYQRAQELFSSVDIWINNASVNQPDKAVYELTKNKIDFLIDIDLKGTIYGSSIAFKNMKKLGFGQIYNIEGYGSNDAMMLGLSIYGTSKRAVIYFKKLQQKDHMNLQIEKLKFVF